VNHLLHTSDWLAEISLHLRGKTSQPYPKYKASILVSMHRLCWEWLRRLLDTQLEAFLITKRSGSQLFSLFFFKQIIIQLSSPILHIISTRIHETVGIPALHYRRIRISHALLAANFQNSLKWSSCRSHLKRPTSRRVGWPLLRIPKVGYLALTQRHYLASWKSNRCFKYNWECGVKTPGHGDVINPTLLII
jgi:hypothetical protein